MKAQPRVWRVFAAPVAIGVVTAVGLLAALLWEPLGRYLAWIALALPIATVMWAVARRRS